MRAEPRAVLTPSTRGRRPSWRLAIGWLALLFVLGLAHYLAHPGRGGEGRWLPIVGGSPSAQDAWPYMSAIMHRDMALEIAGLSLPASYLVGSPMAWFDAPLVDCSQGFSACAGAEGAVCLIERGETLFYEKAANCAAGGGVAALIYNNVAGDYSGTLGDAGASIPTLSVSREVGLELLGYLGQGTRLVYSDSVPEGSFCGASYIGGAWVVTAAHCVEDLTAEALLVNVGGTDLVQDQANVIGVAEIIVHHYYSPYRNGYDIALLRLKKAPVGVTPVALADAAVTARAIDASARVSVLGRGNQEPMAPDATSAADTSTSALYQLDVHLVSNAVCNAAISSYLRSQGVRSGTPVHDDMLCAGELEEGIGVCFGDSGGPLIYQEGGVDYLMGITSWGYGCAQADLYDGYTRVAYFQEVLEAILAGAATDFSGTQPTTTPTRSSGGGGAPHLWLLFGLSALYALRRVRPYLR